MTNGLTGGFRTNVSPSTLKAYCDVTQACAFPNGSEALPYPTLQAAFDAGARELVTAPGTYGALAVAAGELVTLAGDEVLSVLGALSGSGGAEIFARGQSLSGLSFTDSDSGNFASLSECTLGAGTYSGGATGGHGECAMVNCDFAPDLTFANWGLLILDDYTERQALESGAIFTSSVAGPIAFDTAGSLPHASMLVDRDETVTMAKRVLLGKNQISANRALTVTPNATVGKAMMIDSYNQSGHTVDVKLAAATIFTIPSSATKTRYFLRTTVANTTWVLDWQMQIL